MLARALVAEGRRALRGPPAPADAARLLRREGWAAWAMAAGDGVGLVLAAALLMHLLLFALLAGPPPPPPPRAAARRRVQTGGVRAPTALLTAGSLLRPGAAPRERCGRLRGRGR
jgi:hypothetical protein